MTTDIRSAFREIQADESKCARRSDGTIYFRFVKGVLCCFSIVRLGEHVELTPPFQYANKAGQESFSMDQILADWQVLKLSDVKGE